MLGRTITVLVTVRDIRAIVASVEKLYQKNPLTSPRPADYLGGQSIEGRARRLVSETGITGIAINRLRNALRRPHNARIFLIPYNQLCRNTQAVMNQIHSQLSLEPFKYDPEHVQQITYEDDATYGMPLHNVRSRVELGDPHAVERRAARSALRLAARATFPISRSSPKPADNRRIPTWRRLIGRRLCAYA